LLATIEEPQALVPSTDAKPFALEAARRGARLEALSAYAASSLALARSDSSSTFSSRPYASGVIGAGRDALRGTTVSLAFIAFSCGAYIS
jgi:hypothetical protein